MSQKKSLNLSQTQLTATDRLDFRYIVRLVVIKVAELLRNGDYIAARYFK